MGRQHHACKQTPLRGQAYHIDKDIGSRSSTQGSTSLRWRSTQWYSIRRPLSKTKALGWDAKGACANPVRAAEAHLA